MKNNVKNLVVFVCICTIITLLLATTNFIPQIIVGSGDTSPYK